MNLLTLICLLLAGIFVIVAIVSLLGSTFQKSDDADDAAFAYFMLTGIFLIAAGVWRQ